MELPEQSSDPHLSKFDKWLKDSKIEPPTDLLARVRASLRDSSTRIDEKMDELFQPDPALSDPQMIWKVRARLAERETDSDPVRLWFRWLAPLTAAATIALAFVSFQSQGPVAVPQQDNADSLALVDASVDLDEDMTRILALAANLDGTSNVSKLESVENLSFLFE